MSGVQLRLGSLPIDPHQAAKLTTPERGKIYNALDLCPLQRQAADLAQLLRAAAALTHPDRHGDRVEQATRVTADLLNLLDQERRR